MLVGLSCLAKLQLFFLLAKKNGFFFSQWSFFSDSRLDQTIGTTWGQLGQLSLFLPADCLIYLIYRKKSGPSGLMVSFCREWPSTRPVAVCGISLGHTDLRPVRPRANSGQGRWPCAGLWPAWLSCCYRAGLAAGLGLLSFFSADFVDVFLGGCEVVEDHGKAAGLDLHEPHGAQADRSGRRGGVACTVVGPRWGPLTVSACCVWPSTRPVAVCGLPLGHTRSSTCAP